ncbi:MAG: YicC/YloC family endoribonuclease, partial [Pygmaiobacter sp.]
VNEALAANYLAALREVATTLGVKDEVSADMIVHFPDVLTLAKADEDEDALWIAVCAVLDEAIDRFIEMRTAEGERMVTDVLARLVFLEQAVTQIEATSEERVQKYTDRLYEKLTVLLEDRNIDDARILTEAAIFSDKTAVDEETVRLRSHIKQYREILTAGGPVGRKLDFLTQELNRETNTIGSKCQELSITRLVVEMKAEIEKIREQIQNLE